MSKQGKQREYINMDGSPYGIKGGGLVRFLSTPTFQGSLIISAFCVAAEMTLRPGNARHDNDFIISFLTHLPVSVILTNIVVQDFFNRSCPVSKDTVIDKSGYPSHDHQTTARLTSFYARTAVINMLWAAFAEFGETFVGTPKPLNPLAFCIMVNATWQLWAHHKLKTGKWTAVTKPPVQKKEEKKIASGASVGVLPVRANFAPSVTNTPLTPQ